MKTYNILLAAVLSATAVACTAKFEDYNTNKHEVTQEQIENDNILTGALFQQLERGVIEYRYTTAEGTPLDSDYQLIYNLCGETWAGYLAPTLGNGHNNSAFQINDGWSRAMFVDKFKWGVNAWSTLHQVTEEYDLQEIGALADILKVAILHQVTDYYGPIPYSEIGKSLTPVYDSQKDVYTAMFNDLDAAIEILETFHTAYPAASIMGDFDLVYAGDVAKWIRFANSLRLRLAMRVVYADETLARTEAEKSLSSTMGVITENADNATIAGIDHHPIYEIAVNFNDADTQLGASMDCYLNGYNDPRMLNYARAASDGKVHGVRPGIEISNWTPYKNPANNVSGPNAGSFRLTWMNAAEVYFLRAEAALRGWNAGGSAKELYEAGIATSFSEWGASGDAASYAANTTRKPADFVDVVGSASAAAPGSCTIAWANDGSFETNLEKIMTQKWLALYPNGAEAWAEYRRTRYPHLLTPANNFSDGVVDTDLQIRRVPFPISEQSDNARGYAAGLSALGGPDNAGTKLWWDKK